MIIPPDTITEDTQINDQSQFTTRDPVSYEKVILIIGLTILFSFLPFFWQPLSDAVTTWLQSTGH